MEGTKRALAGPVTLLLGVFAILGLLVRASLGHPGEALYAEASKPRIQRAMARHIKTRHMLHPIMGHTELRGRAEIGRQR